MPMGAQMRCPRLRLNLARYVAMIGLVVASVARDTQVTAGVRRLQGNESGFRAGWNGEASSPPMLWRGFSGCMYAGLPGDNSSCGGSYSSGLGAGKRCSTCSSWATAIKAITAKKWPLGSRIWAGQKIVSEGSKIGRVRTGCLGLVEKAQYLHTPF